MATIVLVSGAWHGIWCWQFIAPLLEAQGHRVVTPELLSMGSDPTPSSEVSLTRWADQVASTVQSQKEPVVLVGHSRGGIVISEVAERVPQSIRMLVYLSAFLLPDGETLGGFVARASGGAKASFLVPGADGKTTTVAKEAVARVFYNATPDKLVRLAEDNMGPEPMAVFGTPLSLSQDNFGRVPRAYIECLRDNAVPNVLQKAMQSVLPCKPVEILDSDHCPFFSAPDLLAQAIDRLAVGAADKQDPDHLPKRS